MSGPNARVNLSSHDQSTNVAIEGDVFGNLTTKLRSEINDQEALEKLIAAVARLESMGRFYSPREENNGLLASPRHEHPGSFRQQAILRSASASDSQLASISAPRFAASVAAGEIATTIGGLR